MPDLRDPRFSLERETLKLVVQQPALAAPVGADLGDNDFTHPAYQAVWETAASLGGPAAAPAPEVWVDKLRTLVGERRGADRAGGAQRARRRAAADRGVRRRPTPRPASTACRSSRCCAASPTSSRGCSAPTRSTRPPEYNRMFGELVALESHRRTLRERADRRGGVSPG